MQIDRHIALSAGWVAGPAFGLAMMAAPDYLHLKPQVAAALFWGGLTIFFLTIIVVIGISFTEKGGARPAFWRVTIGAVTLLGVFGAWYFWPASTLSSEAPQKAERKQPPSILFGCGFARLPKTSGSGYIALIDFPYPKGGGATGIGFDIVGPGEPGQALDWTPWEKSPQYICKITNYSPNPIFQLHFTLNAKYYDSSSREAFSKMDTIFTENHPCDIASIDPKETVTFYVVGSSYYSVHVTGPNNVYFSNPETHDKETPTLLPGSNIYLVVGGAPINPPAASPPSPAPPTPPGKTTPRTHPAPTSR